MARALCIEFSNAFYHVMSRGLNRQNLFFDDDDFQFFIYLLEQAHIKFKMICLSFCLMNNHYHLYIRTPEPNLSRIMKFINESYARYYLKKYPEKDGHVFKGRYKRKIVQSDTYSFQLSRYIHLNPVVANLVASPSKWKWSSYSSFITQKKKFGFLDKDWLLNQFSASSKRKAVKNFIEYTCKEEGLSWDPDKHTHAKLVLGSTEYFKQIVNDYIDIDKPDQDIECYQELNLAMQYEKQDLINFVNALELKEKERMQSLAYLLKEHTNLSLKDIGLIVNKKPKTVSASVISIKNKILKNKELEKLLVPLS
jgi:putative transposase